MIQCLDQLSVGLYSLVGKKLSDRNNRPITINRNSVSAFQATQKRIVSGRKTIQSVEIIDPLRLFIGDNRSCTAASSCHFSPIVIIGKLTSRLPISLKMGSKCFYNF
ncbi:MAG: hypothetical protein AAF353_04710, partial [Pseudomonadota bacterium]